MITGNLSDRALFVDILTESFDSNVSVNFVVRQDKNRNKRIRKLMEYSFDLCLLFGNVYLTEDRNGCALVLYPEMKKTTFKTILLDLKLALSSIGLFRVVTVLNRDAKIKKHYPANNKLFYLWFIGVKQRKGIGTELLNDLKKESIIQNRPIYLETSMKSNVDFYEKQGFHVYQTLDSPHQLFLLKSI
jgi:hypothetical protein